MSDERERLIEIFLECLNDIDFGQSGDDTTDIIWHIKKLRGDAKAARAELAKLREACAGISEGLIRTATHGVENGTKREWLIQTAQNIRVALESEAGE